MNNYDEEYFEDENDLEEEHFGDFVDFWDDTPEFDEQIEEFKTALRADVKREIKELIEKLQKELDELKDYKACKNEIEAGYRNVVAKLKKPNWNSRTSTATRKRRKYLLNAVR